MDTLKQVTIDLVGVHNERLLAIIEKVMTEILPQTDAKVWITVTEVEKQT